MCDNTIPYTSWIPTLPQIALERSWLRELHLEAHLLVRAELLHLLRLDGEPELREGFAIDREGNGLMEHVVHDDLPPRHRCIEGSAEAVPKDPKGSEFGLLKSDMGLRTLDVIHWKSYVTR